MNGDFRYEPYPEYKPSGIVWLGDVPAHWEVRRLRNAVDMRVSNVDKHIKDGEMPVRLCNYVDVYKNERITDGIPFMQATATASEVGRFRLELSDVLITKDSETWDDIGVPALVDYAASDLICGYHLAMLRPMNLSLEGGFLLRVLQSSAIGSQFYISARGVTRYGLTHEAIKSVILPVPPLDEQAAIVSYLDRADDRIHRAISAKERLIELLTEQCQAVIHRAVTRGLDPDAPLKDSGVEWLGAVPEHWEVRRLKTLLARPLQNGIFKKKEQFGFGAPLINVADVYRENFRVEPSLLDRVQISPDEARRFQVQDGDIFFVRSSLKLEGTGRSAVAVNCSPDTVFECHLVGARPENRRVNPKFLAFQLNSHTLHHYLISRANMVTMATVAQDTIASCPLLIPPRSEQDGIVKWTETQLNQITLAIESANKEITLLHEYRTRLIADVVTGQVDVRGAVVG